MTLSTHCNGFTGNPLASGQVPVPGVPGYGGVDLPSGTVSGVCVMLHGLLPYVLPGQSLPSYKLFGEGLGTLSADLTGDNWAVLWPSYPSEGAGNVNSATALIADMNSATSGGGTQYLTTVLEWWDHVVLYIHQTWPGQKIAVAGWSEGAFMACTIAARKQSTIIGGVAHEPATIWNNITALTGYTFPTVANLNLSTSALSGVTVPFMVSYGTADNFVGWQNPGGSFPTSNTDAMITNGGSGVVRNSTADTHQLTSTDATTFHSFFTGHLNGLR